MARTRSLVQHDRTTVASTATASHTTGQAGAQETSGSRPTHRYQDTQAVSRYAESGRNPEATRTLHGTHHQDGGPHEPESLLSPIIPAGATTTAVAEETSTTTTTVTDETNTTTTTVAAPATSTATTNASNETSSAIEIEWLDGCNSTNDPEASFVFSTPFVLDANYRWHVSSIDGDFIGRYTLRSNDATLDCQRKGDGVVIRLDVELHGTTTEHELVADPPAS